MDRLYQQLIDRERQKIGALQARIARIEGRIAILAEMAEEELDDGVTTTASQRKAELGEQNQETGNSLDDAALPDNSSMPKRKLTEKSLVMLSYIGKEGKTLDQLEAFSNERGFDMDRHGLRSFTNLYRRRYRLLVADRQGFYRLTDAGIHYLQDYPPSTLLNEPEDTNLVRSNIDEEGEQ